MVTSRHSRSPPSGKDIAQQMRERIASGAWSAGQRIPTKLELCQQFGTSNMTMQKALAVLAKEGFIRSRGRAGTFVSGEPPSRHRFAFIVPAGHLRSLWYGSLVRALGLHEGAGHIEVHQASEPGTAPADAALLADCQAHRLAGALLAAPFPGLTRLIAGLVPGFPLVHLSPPAGPDECHAFTTTSPADLVVGALAGSGRQRLALFGTFMHSKTLAREAVAKAQAAGMRCEPEWIHLLDPRSPDIARGIARLLASLPAERRPDAIYISDDHLATATTAGLHDAGLRAPEDIEIVCHANIPFPPPTCLPVTYAGYDVIALMRAGVDSLSRLASGQDVPARQPCLPILCSGAEMAHRQHAAIQAETAPRPSSHVLI
jgi:DNA-binding LacI/PurR family transcriptional regulator